MLKYIYTTKNEKQHTRKIICNTGCEYLTQEQFEGQANHCERDWFSFEIIPVLKWLSLSSTATNHYYIDK